MAFVGDPPLWLESAEEVHVSCTFTWDRREAERLASAWRFRFPSAVVKVGGPAYGDPGGDFTPGLYLKRGYVITSRGCPNRCPWCKVPIREGAFRTLPITNGWEVQDNNVLVDLDHLRAVCEMLKRQPERPRFTGGLEAALLTEERARLILDTKPDRLFLAFDRPEQLRVVRQACRILRALSGWKAGTFRHHVSIYVMVGYPGDTTDQAERRIAQAIETGARVFPMFYRDDNYTHRPAEWDQLVGGVCAMGGHA
jgi:hypothetical protein